MVVMATKSNQIKSLLVSKIRQGEFLPGEKIYSERKLADEYKIARATAAKILEELERENFIVRKQGKGTFVNDLSRKIYNIAYLYNRKFPADYPWMTKLLAGMERHRGSRKFRLNVYGEKEGDLGHIKEDITGGRLDGLLINVELGEANMIFLEQHNVQAVFIENRPRHLGLKYPVVGIDHFQVSYRGVKHLYEQGYRKIIAICGFSGPTTREGFIKGFREAIAECGMSEADERIFQCDWSSDASRKIILENYGRVEFDAVICSDDIQASGVLSARNELGLTQKELGVVGSGNLFAVRDDAELTTFRTYVEDVGEIALRKLLDLIEHKPIDVLQKYIEPKLIIRKSSIRQ